MTLLRSLLTSKKFLAMLSGIIGVIALKVFKVAVDSATVGELVALIAAYIIGQGQADKGKEAAKIAAVSTDAQRGGIAAQEAVIKFAGDVK